MPRSTTRSITQDLAALSHRPRVVVASGMQGTGVSTIADLLQRSSPTLQIVDGGSTWAGIAAACAPGFTTILAVTTHDIVSVSSTYALVKMVRDRFPGASVEVLVNLSEAREALKTYERIQTAASHFLRETVGYAGAVPEDGLPIDDDHVGIAHTGALVGASAVSAIEDLALRLDDELSVVTERTASRRVERRMIQ
jgi:MinD-like ATPase involved in chromosome partitioning or flagellar assembly